MANASLPVIRHGTRLRHYTGYSLALLAALAGWRALDRAAHEHLFLINRSPSLPNWAYVVERSRLPERGTVSFFMPPRSALVQAHFGTVPAAFGKIAYGLPGDRVLRVGADVFVQAAGTNLPRKVGTLKPSTARGEALAAGPTGEIPPGCYYMGSPHKDGFDSRYKAIGFVCTNQLIGVASAVLL